MSKTYTASKNASVTYTTDAQPSKLAQTGKVVGTTAVVAAAGTAYVVASSLATYAFSKLGEKIWDAL